MRGAILSLLLELAATLGFAGHFRGVRQRNRKSSDLRLDTNDVRFIFPPPETVLSFGHRHFIRVANILQPGQASSEARGA